MTRKKCRLIRLIGICLNTIIVIVSLIISTIIKDFNHQQLLVIAIFVLQIFSIVLDNLYQKSIDIAVFGNKKEKQILLQEADPDRYKNSIQGAREELRFGLNILMSISIVCCLFWGIITLDILKPAICICFLCIAYIYADYVPHAKSYAKRYDRMFLQPGEKATSNQGLARIYLEEYVYEKNCSQQEECIKNILRIGMDSVNSYWLIFSIIITFFNAIFIFPDAMGFVVSTFIKNVTINIVYIYPIIILVLNILFFVINLVSLFSYQENCEATFHLANLIIENDPCARFEEYKNYFEKKKAIRFRGIFVFCATYMDHNISLDTIELKYRMLYTHRLDANCSRFWLTVVLIGLSVLFLLIDLGINWTTILVVGEIYVIIAIIFRLAILEKIGKHRIIKLCEQLK